MNILMMTNTYLPHVGGVARSVETFAAEYRNKGHRVLVVAPEFEGVPDREEGVIRLPALQRFNGSDFSVRLPLPAGLSDALDAFQPDVVHSHHPFLVGDTALRIAEARGAPLAFTHHTLYERYTHYVPGDSPALRRFVIDLSTGYANLCDLVIAPSRSVARLLRERGVERRIETLPTGIPIERFAAGDGRAFRRRWNVPENAFVAGHLGRLAPEKNLAFLAAALSRLLFERPGAHVLIGGDGPEAAPMREIFAAAGVADRVRFCGRLEGRDVPDFYHAADVFAFASKTETQGLVLAEAMAAGTPVVALDASGVDDVVRDGVNGFLLPKDDAVAFARRLAEVADLDAAACARMREGAAQTASAFSSSACADRALDLYAGLVAASAAERAERNRVWRALRRVVEAEWKLWANRAQAAEAAFGRKG